MPLSLLAFPVDRGPAEISFENGFLYGRRGGAAHDGIDILAGLGMTIVCPVRGQVVRMCNLRGQHLPGVGNSTNGGNYAVVVDWNRNFHYFSHMQNPARVSPGATIWVSEVIGALGHTGNAQGVDHLHYQVWEPFTHDRAEEEYASLNFPFHFSRAINPHPELTRLANALGARHNPGGRYFIPPL
jgi:murein DD-endopeptidase MepM/ murein hydrolase activator NlpD